MHMLPNTSGLLLLIMFLLLPAHIAGQQQEELTPSQRATYGQGMQLLRDRQVDDAIEMLEKVVRKDTRYAPVLNTLAEAYMARNSLQDRLKAERLLKRALEVDHTNVDYNLNLGKLHLLQGLPISAREQFEKTLTLNKNAVRAHFELGRLHLEDMLLNDHMISLDDPLNIVHYYDRFANRQSETDAGVRRDRLSRASDAVTALDSVFQEESFKACQAARTAFEKVLAVIPEDRDANYYRGLLEFYRNDYQSMTRYARHLVMNNPDDRDGLLLLGLGLTRLQEYDPAWAMFERALSLMTPEERREFTTAALVMGETESLEDMDDAETKRFWASQDPLFMTRYNERELEHFSRVIEANLRFTVEANANSSGIKAVTGWKTDRGRFFIKYGKPQQWYSLRSDIPGIGAVDAGGGRPYEKRGLELWHYKEFSIGFWDPYHSGKAVFADDGVFPGMDFREEAGVLSKEIPQIYYTDYEAKQFNVPYTVTQFRGSGGMTDLHVTYGLPSRKLRFIPDQQEEIPELKFAYARLIQHPGSLQQTAEQYNLAAIDDKDFPGAHHEFGRALQQMGRLDDAASWLERAKRLDPRYSSFYQHRRFPELIEDWEQTAVDSLAWFMDYHVSDLRPDSTTLAFWYMLPASQSVEQVESLIDARLTVFDADWNIVKHRSFHGSVQHTAGERWIDGGLHMTLKPGRYFLSMALMEKHSRRFGCLVRDVYSLCTHISQK